MFSAARPAIPSAILSAPAYRRAVGNVRILLGCWLMYVIVELGPFILRLPHVLAWTLDIVRWGVWAGIAVTTLSMGFAVNQLASQFSGLKPWSRQRHALAAAVFRDAVTRSRNAQNP
jgi:hypothetical protein